MQRKNATRREFLSRMAAAGTVGGLGACATSATRKAPTRAKPVALSTGTSKRHTLGANERIQCGFIGVGNRGTSLLETVLGRADVDVIAVADIYDTALAKAAGQCRSKYSQVRSYVRFEDLLEKEKLDAVVIATPDHIHAPAILGALDCGYDVYTEKPMTLTWQDAQQVRDRAPAAGAVVQVGTQLRSMPMYQKAREAYQSGAIGRLVAVQVERHSGRGRTRPVPEDLNESHVQWDLFLRDTKPYPFDPNRFLNWRRYLEYSNGAAGDLMLHHLDIFHFITGCGMPERVMSVGGVYFYEDGRTCPDTIGVLLEYPERFQFSFTTTYVNGHYGLMERYLGSEGTIEIREMSEMSIYRSAGPSEKGDGDQEEIVPSAGVFNEPHLDDFFRCMRTREQTIAPVDAGCIGATCCHMAVLSEQTGESAKWDAATNQVAL